MVENLPLGPGCRCWIVKKRGEPRLGSPLMPSRSGDLLSLVERRSLDEKIEPNR